LPRLRLTLLVGSYAQVYYPGAARQPTLDATVWAWRSFLPDFLPLPHPSWCNIGWLKRNPWFESELVPALQAQVGQALAG
jgi:uracil-DNA glycosylase